MPDPPQYLIDKPIFQGARNGVVSCQVGDCTWDFAGPRDTLKHAWNEHYRMNHSQDVGVVYVNQNLRQSLWLPASR